MPVEMQDALSELESDALIEIFNIGVGRSASALNKMVSQTVELSVPHVQLVKNWQLIDRLKAANAGRISAVSQKFVGDFSGTAMLIFSQESGLALVRELLGENIPLSSLSDMEQDSLVEVGNIILNACFGTVINFLETKIKVEMPRFQQGSVSDLYSDVQTHQSSLYVEVKFVLPNDSIEGYISFLMDIRSLGIFKQSIRDFVHRMTHPS
jgi:chemotaxis protein CheC